MTTHATCTLDPIDVMRDREKDRDNLRATKGPSMLAQARSPFDRRPASSTDRVAPLIVGFDGSTAAMAAVTWAATSGPPIIVVRVLQPRPAGTIPGSWAPSRINSDRGERPDRRHPSPGRRSPLHAPLEAVHG
jgi:hypothetical protein